MDKESRLLYEKMKEHILYNVKNIIQSGFNINDRRNKTINYTNNECEMIIHRNCYHHDNRNNYYEDYTVHYGGIIDGKKIKSSFYMEWKDNAPDGELLPANTRWCPIKNEFSHREIKIRIEN